jgi:6-phospho-3-hexuloisomerase
MMSDGIGKKLNSVLAEIAALAARLDRQQADSLVDALTGGGDVFVAGAGRSGLLLRCFVMRLMHMGRCVHMVGDVTTPSAHRGDTLFIGSGSGETGSLVSIAKKAKALGMTIALVTTNPASTIAGLADTVVVLPAPTPKNANGADSVPSAQPMGTLFEQGMSLVLDCVIMLLMEREGLSSDAMFARHANLE